MYHHQLMISGVSGAYLTTRQLKGVVQAGQKLAQCPSSACLDSRMERRRKSFCSLRTPLSRGDWKGARLLTCCRDSSVAKLSASLLSSCCCSSWPSSSGPLLSAVLARHPGIAVGCIMNTLVYIIGRKILLKGLALDGFVSSWVLGLLSFSAFGVYGYVLVCLYFILGSWVTKLKMDVKVREGTAEAKGGRRGIGSVLGSGVAGMVCAGMALLQDDIPMAVLQAGFVASFCSKLSDTVSSEIGKAFGKTTYLATTFERVPRGTEGAVSMEGTLAGMAASLFLGCCGVLVQMITFKGLLYVITAAFVANYAESVLGAMYQDRVSWLTNDLVNIFQITCASIVSMLLSYLFM